MVKTGDILLCRFLEGPRYLRVDANSGGAMISAVFADAGPEKTKNPQGTRTMLGDFTVHDIVPDDEIPDEVLRMLAIWSLEDC